MIAKVIFAISTEESRFQLNGALFKLKPDGLEMVATDGHRLALVEAAAGGADGTAVTIKKAQEGVLIPRKALQELLRFEGWRPSPTGAASTTCRSPSASASSPAASSRAPFLTTNG